MDDTLAKNIGIIGRSEVGAARWEGGNVLGEQLDMLLGRVAGLLDRLSAPVQAVGEPLGIVLDFVVQVLQVLKDGLLEVLLRLDVTGDHALGIGAQNLEHGRYTDDIGGSLGEVISFPQGMANGLPNVVSIHKAP